VWQGEENIGILKGKNKEGALSFLHFYYQDEIMLKITDGDFYQQKFL